MARYTNWPQYNPGRFRTLVTLLEQVAGTDESGVSTTYLPGTPPKKCYADIEYVHGQDQLRSGQDVTQAFMTCTAWFNPAFTAQKQISVNGDGTYIIQAVENERLQNVLMILTCLRIGVAPVTPSALT